MTVKPPYTKSLTLKTNPHVDWYFSELYYMNGSYAKEYDNSYFVSNDTFKHSHTSQSTKPWPKGKPEIWTPQTRSTYEWLVDKGSGTVVWTPGAQWTAVRQRIRSNTGGWGTTFKSATWLVSDQASDYPDKATLDNKIRNKLLDEFNAAVMLAETRKTVESVTKRIVTLYRAASAVRRGEFSKAVKVLGYPPRKKLTSARKRSLNREIADPKYRGLASDWLELQYGWLPLISDIFNAVEYAGKQTPAKRFIRATSTKSGIRTATEQTSSRIDGGLSVNKQFNMYKSRRSWIAEVALDDMFFQRMSETGLINPAVVAWELVPFSFVVDWFLPIGSFLSSATATCGVTVKGNLYIESMDRTYGHTSSLKSATSADRAEGYGEIKERRFTYTRSSPGFPSAKFPSFKNPLSATHAANALALLTSIFTKR